MKRKAVRATKKQSGGSGAVLVTTNMVGTDHNQLGTDHVEGGRTRQPKAVNLSDSEDDSQDTGNDVGQNTDTH